MQEEILTANPDSKVRLLAVNQLGYESGNALMASAGDAPWLQETAASPSWRPWKVVYRDTVILDGQNRRVGVFNLTDHDLQQPAEYAALKAMLLAAAGE